MITWFLTPNFWGFLLHLRRKWWGIMQIALSSWTVCTSFHIMIFLDDVFSVLSWRFGVQCLPSICGRIILSPCFLSSSCWTGYHGMKFIVTFLPRCLLDVAFRAFSLSAVGKLFHGNYVRWPVSAIQPTSFQCTISSHAPLQLMNPSILPAHAFSCAGPFAVFCIRVCIIFLWYITLLLLFHMEWKDMAWSEMAYMHSVRGISLLSLVHSSSLLKCPIQNAGR